MDIFGPIVGGFEMIIEMLQSGGIISYLILLLGVYGIIISIRKILYLRKISRIDATEIMGTVTASMEKGGAIEALKNISHYRNPVSKIISEALKIAQYLEDNYRTCSIHRINRYRTWYLDDF